MSAKASFTVDIDLSLAKLLAFISNNEHYLLLNNSYTVASEKKFDYLIGIGRLAYLTVFSVDEVNAFIATAAKNKQTVFVHLTYPLKNKFEKLTDRYTDIYAWPEVHFFVAEAEIVINNKEVKIQSNNGINPEEIKEAILKTKVPSEATGLNEVNCLPSLNRNEYIDKLEVVLKHIQRGDIYEMNFCFPFTGNGAIDPVRTYDQLTRNSPAPFSCLYRMKHNYLICSSPERFISKTGSTIISQPIKGTIKRGSNEEEDEILKNSLRNSEKEQSENVMIVDLVRNDLSRIAKRGSVNVDELFGIYTFPAVHQMISTVSAEVRMDVTFSDILEALFPMGSMTGAPKIRAMQIINEQEEFNRGLYSGSVGYITSDGNFDLNVVIRSIIYNEKFKKISIPVGSAITAVSDAGKEYEECLLKAKALLSVIGSASTQKEINQP